MYVCVCEVGKCNLFLLALESPKEIKQSEASGDPPAVQWRWMSWERGANLAGWSCVRRAAAEAAAAAAALCSVPPGWCGPAGLSLSEVGRERV